EPLGHFRGGAGFAPAVEAIEAAHNALDDADVGARRVAGDAGEHALATAHPAVKGVGRAPGGELVEAGVDEVRTDLECLRAQAARDALVAGGGGDARRAAAARAPRHDDDAHRAA